MLDQKRFYAIGALAARLARAEAPKARANDVIDMMPLLRPWKEGVYPEDEVVVYNGLPYRCVQEHDSTGNPSWNPEQTLSLWAGCHATDAAHALEWAEPAGAHDAYMLGEYIRWDGAVYRCVTDGTVHDPDELPASWERC